MFHWNRAPYKPVGTILSHSSTLTIAQIPVKDLELDSGT